MSSLLDCGMRAGRLMEKRERPLTAFWMALSASCGAERL